MAVLVYLGNLNCRYCYYTNGQFTATIIHVSDFRKLSELNDVEHWKAFLVVLGLSSR